MKYFLMVIGFVFAIGAQAGQASISLEGKALDTEGFHSYNFGTVWTNSRNFVRFTVTNTGTTPLTYRNAVIYGADFRAQHSCVNGLLPKERCSFEIEYWPMFEGNSSGRFILNFVEDEVVVDLWGQARRM
jgi:hypothetical protein